MKAAQLVKYSKKHPKYQLTEIEEAPLGPEDIRVEVKAAAVNPLDYKIAHGDVRLLFPYKLPLTLGNELVGVITELGEKVRGFEIGERIFARMPVNQIGAFAESAVFNYRAAAHVPEYLTDEEAAAVPLTALTAVQAMNMFDNHAGDTLFISGGTGSFGQMAIPIAVERGFKVITSGSSENYEKVKQLGIEQFIDYHVEDYSKVLHDIDFAIDTIGGKEVRKTLGILRPGGAMVSLHNQVNKEFAERMGVNKLHSFLFSAAGWPIDYLAKKEGKKYYFIFVRSSGKELNDVAQLLNEKQIHPAVGNVYSLDEFQVALEDIEQGHNAGKVIIKF